MVTAFPKEHLEPFVLSASAARKVTRVASVHDILTLPQRLGVRTAPDVACLRLAPAFPGAVWVAFVHIDTHVLVGVTLPCATTATQVREPRVPRSVTHIPEPPIVQCSGELRTLPNAPHVQ